jgi:hypothetical protein
MTITALNRDRVYAVVAIVLSIALSCSLIPPEGWGLLFGVGVAHAAPLTTVPASMSPSGINSPATETVQNALSSDLAKQLSDIGVLNSDGQPNGMLIDVDALQAEARRKPASLGEPLSISRVQSVYWAADAVSSILVITFTVTNNQSPAIVPPPLPASATITNTLQAVSAVDFSKDPNVIHNVLLADSLTGYASFVSSSPIPDRKSSQYAWNLGDVLPLSSITATLKINVPTSVTDFVDLDTGATAWGTLQGRIVSTKARPASLAPDTIGGEPIGDWLMGTVDANKYDKYMLEKAAELGQDPIRMFEYVRSLGYESYKGSLRGTRGTLWGEAGNSMDQASLLIAMLRASGVPSRYRHGTLSTEQAQALILSMFPKPTSVMGRRYFIRNAGSVKDLRNL